MGDGAGGRGAGLGWRLVVVIGCDLLCSFCPYQADCERSLK